MRMCDTQTSPWGDERPAEKLPGKAARQIYTDPGSGQRRRIAVSDPWTRYFWHVNVSSLDPCDFYQGVFLWSLFGSFPLVMCEIFNTNCRCCCSLYVCIHTKSQFFRGESNASQHILFQKFPTMTGSVFRLTYREWHLLAETRTAHQTDQCVHCPHNIIWTYTCFMLPLWHVNFIYWQDLKKKQPSNVFLDK